MSDSTLKEFCERNELTVRSEFVPQSQSRNAWKGKKSEIPFKKLCLNWKVTLVHKGRDILTTDFQAGVNHCPSYEPGRVTVDVDECCRKECEDGRDYNNPSGVRNKPILPITTDVVYSLANEAKVLDYNSSAAWADDMGYGSDSIKGKAVYDACLLNALAMRNGLGEALLAELQQACQDY